MQAEVDRDSERGVQRTGNRKQFWNAIGSRDGADFFKTTGVPLGPGPQALPERPGPQAGGRLGRGLPPGLHEETLGVPEIRMHFPESSSSAAGPASRAQAEATGGGPQAPPQPAPVLSCLRLPASRAPLLSAQAGGAARWAGQRPSWPRRRGQGSLVGGWRARPCIYTLGPRLLS